MNLAKVTICEIQRDRSFKIFQHFAESVRQLGQPAAVHPQRGCIHHAYAIERTIQLEFGNTEQAMNMPVEVQKPNISN